MSLAEQTAATPAMLGLFSPGATVQAMLDVEAALAQAGAATGLISAQSALAIGNACQGADIDLELLADDARHSGTLVIPLVQWLKSRVPGHESAVHVGGTSQDIIDTAMVLQLRAGVALLQADLSRMGDAAATLAQAHTATPLAGRTLLQPALPITLGLKAAYWLAAITDSRRAIAHASATAFFLQCGGAAGTLDVPGENYPAFVQAFAGALALPVGLPWHTARAPLVRLASSIAAAVGAAGKIGTDIALMMQPEIGEAAEPAAPGRGGSSAMAHKRNPTLSIAARAAAIRMPGYIATLLAAQDQAHERAAGAWQAEAVTWTALILCASGGLAAIAQALPGLEINPQRMAENLAQLAPAQPSAAIPHLIETALADHQAFQGTRAHD